MRNYEQLKLENQLCFPVYATSRLIIREYQPHLEKLGITYPQYLVLLVLWEEDKQTVNAIANKLILNTNTITPLLKRMENQNLVVRNRSKSDERRVIVKLTEQGETLKEKALAIPEQLSQKLLDSHLEVRDLIMLKENLDEIIKSLNEQG